MRPAVVYTLIELFVVMSIISIISVVGFVNFKDFSADQVTNKAVGIVQTVLRLAQSNATSSTFCDSQSGVSWKVIFNLDGVSINLVCGPTDFLQRTYSLENASLQIKGSSCGSASTLPISLIYSFGGSLTFSAADSCLQSSSTLTITISNTKDVRASPKSFNLSKGGAIDVQ